MPLPFDPKQLKGITEKLIASHHENNYGGAVRRGERQAPGDQSREPGALGAALTASSPSSGASATASVSIPSTV